MGSLLLRIVGLVVIVVLFILQQTASLPNHSPILATLHNYAHFPWFALITWLMCMVVKPKTRDQLFNLAIFVVLLSVTSEVLQLFSYREFSVLDIFTDLCGGIFVLMLYSAFRFKWVYAAIALVMGAHPVLLTAAAYYQRAQTSPDLLAASSVLSSRLIRQKSRLESTVMPEACSPFTGLPAYKVTFADRPWPSIVLMDVQKNWRSYKRISIDICNPGRLPVNVWIAVRPENQVLAQQGIYRRFTVYPGAKTQSYSLEGLLGKNYPDIQDVIIYAEQEEAGRSILLSSVILSEDP